MASVWKKRARTLARTLREKAVEIEQGLLVPGIGKATRYTGDPVCAFGHACHAAVLAEGLHAADYAGVECNDTLLEKFMNGGYTEEVAYEVRSDLDRLCSEISDANDTAFATPSAPVVAKRDATVAEMRKLAGALEQAAPEGA